VIVPGFVPSPNNDATDFIEKMETTEQVKTTRRTKITCSLLVLFIIMILIFWIGVMHLIFYSIWAIWSTLTAVPCECANNKQLNPIMTFPIPRNSYNICSSTNEFARWDEYPKTTGELFYVKDCENIFNLGENKYVSACTFLGENNIVFTTVDTQNNSTTSVGINWKQFCMIVQVSEYLLDDLNYIINVKPFKVMH